jgi:hypothetical protein
MGKIQPPTEIDLRMHALSLAARQTCEALSFKDDTDMAGETLAIAGRYRDWLANGAATDAATSPAAPERNGDGGWFIATPGGRLSVRFDGSVYDDKGKRYGRTLADWRRIAGIANAIVANLEGGS